MDVEAPVVGLPRAALPGVEPALEDRQRHRPAGAAARELPQQHGVPLEHDVGQGQGGAAVPERCLGLPLAQSARARGRAARPGRPTAPPAGPRASVDVVDPPLTVSQVARMRSRASEQPLDPRALRGRDQCGTTVERVAGAKQRQRPRRQDLMAAALQAKRLRDEVQTRRLGQAGGHAEAESAACGGARETDPQRRRERGSRQQQFRSRYNPPGQPQLGFPREHLIRSREEIVWGLQHAATLEERRAWEAKDKVLFEKNRLRKMILDKLTQENNDKQQAKD